MKSSPDIPARIYKKVFGSALILFFSLSLFAAGAFSGGCSDATGCFGCNLQGPHAFSAEGSRPVSPGCPSGSCDFENSTASEGLPNTLAAISVDNSNIGYAAGAADDFSNTRFSKRFILLPAFTKPAPSPPVYLLNRSLLC